MTRVTQIISNDSKDAQKWSDGEAVTNGLIGTATTMTTTTMNESDNRIQGGDVEANSHHKNDENTSIVSNGDAPHANQTIAAAATAADDPANYAAGATATPPPPPAAKMTEEELAVEKRSYVLQELVESEVLYVQDLKKVVEDYMPRMKSENVPEGLQGNKDLIIFGNIQVR